MRLGHQRGYNLVEMMIALAVLGLIVGGALIPLKQRLEEAKINSAEEQLQEAKSAVFAYALSHSTRGGSINYYDGANYTLPAGRPYLPCPDVTGDGNEDRTALPANYPFSAANAADLVDKGTCAEHKGMLPWKTLGLKGLDSWGNRLTYRVDRKYASSLFGFDEAFYADGLNYAVPLITRPVPLPKIYDNYASRDDTGAVICSDLYDDSTNGGCPKLDLSNLEAGIVTTVTLDLGHRVIAPYSAVDISTAADAGIVNGAVFVIVSHGHDGAGAINHSGQCRPPPAATNNIGEIANAYYRSGHPFRSGSFNCAIPPVTTANILHENQFVLMPISDLRDDNVDSPDDLVIWAGSNELLGYLSRTGKLPLKKLDYLML